MDGDAYIQLLAKWVQREGKRLAQRSLNPPTSISLHHLYYLLTRFDDLEVPVGPLNIRLEDIHDDERQGSASSASNYVSFSKRNDDAASIRSVSSIRSVMSTVTSSVWHGFGVFGGSAPTEDQIVQDLKQLYSAFCKIPAIRICPNKKVQLVSGFEEYPFDTAVPVLAFKNMQFLEIHDYSPKQFYGWDEISEQLRSLVVKRAGLEDVETLIIGCIKDEQEKKKRKADRTQRHWQNISETSSSAPHSPRIGNQTYNFQAPRSIDHSRAPSPNLGRPSLSRNSSARLDRKSSVERKYGNARKYSVSSSGSDTPLPFHLGPEKWHFLRFLSLSDNGLSEVSLAALAPLAANLNYLDLSKNNLTSIPGALSSLSSLRSLDVSRNKIETLHSLLQNPIPGISTLNLRGNRLSTIAGIDRLPSLERVDLRDNKLKDPMEIARLSTAPNFVEIWVAENNFTRTHADYRTTIFNIFRGNPHVSEDVAVDGKKPGMLEKRTLIPRAVERPSLKPTQQIVALDIPSTAPLEPCVSTNGLSPLSNGTAGTTKPKKKVHKSRIVDLSSSPERPAARRSSNADDNNPLSPTSDSSNNKQPITVSAVDKPTSPSKDLLDAEEYRKKIEALKGEVGSGWLRVINEDSFRPQSPAKT